jgi:hypothetical protein
VVGEDTEDLGEVRINFAGELCLGEDMGKLRVAGDPVELVNAILLTLTDQMEAAFDVSSLACELSILGDLDGSFIVTALGFSFFLWSEVPSKTYRDKRLKRTPTR